jgi:hypothetical protein
MTRSRLDLVKELSVTQRQVMFLISRHKKKRPSNAFSEEDLSRRLEPRGINPLPILEELQALGIVQVVDPAKHLWTVVDSVVEHECERQALEAKYGFRVQRR